MELFISGVFHIMFSDNIPLWVMEPSESKSVGKGDCCTISKSLYHINQPRSV